MLEEGTKHDQIRRHDNEFDKTTREIRVDAFKKNAGGHAQECAQLAFRTPHAALDCASRTMCTQVLTWSDESTSAWCSTARHAT
jgi:hypothetical protein